MLGKSLLKQFPLLTAKEWKQFLLWLQSPVHNTDEKLVRLGQYFRNPKAGWSPEIMSKEKLWTTLYEDKPLNEGVLRVKLRQFTEQLEDFLVWNHLKTKRKDYYQRLYLETQVAHSSYQDFERRVMQFLRKMEGTNSPDLTYSYQKAALFFLLLYHPKRDSYQIDNTHALDFNNYLDTFFILSKFRLGNKLQNRALVLGEEVEISFWPAIINACANAPVKSNMIIQLYLKLFQLQAKELSFSEFKQAYLSTVNTLPIIDHSGIYYAVLNYLSRLINTGQAQFYQETFSWYQLGLEEKILLQNGRISEVTFNNIALLGYETQHFSWVDSFFDTYQTYLAKDVREDAVRASRGLGHFYQKHYTQAVQVLGEHRFSTTYQLRVRLTIGRSLYELLRQDADVYDDLDKHLSAFDSYLRRNKKFSTNALLPYQNHIRILRKLMSWQFNTKMEVETITQLIEEVKQQKVVAKRWLVEKLEDAVA